GPTGVRPGDVRPYGRRTPWGRRPAVLSPPARRAGSYSSPGALRGELGDLGDVGLVDEGRAGQHGLLTAAAVVAVVLVEPQRVDRQVALQIRLLVDRELDRALADRGREVLVEVEGRDLGLAA